SQNDNKLVKRKKQTNVSQYLYHPLPDNIQQQFEQHIIRGTVASGLPFKWIQDEDIVAAFKLINPTIKLPSRHKLSGSILKKEYKKVLEMSQLRGKIMQERKLKSIEKAARQIHNPHIVLPIVSDSEENYSSQDSDLELDQVDDNRTNNDIHWEEVVANWLMLLKNEQFEEDLDLTEIDETVHPATSQEAKWPLLQIFQDNIEQPDSYNLLLGN
ncbi:15653_t:CDS:2, partial [Racocetra fulgida]